MEMLKRGVGIKAVSGYLGHADVSTTLSYYVHETASYGDVLG
jgi:site-specific recombinase XerD